MKILLAQLNPTIGDLFNNKNKILSQIKLGREKNADLIVFPELSITGYPPKDLLYRDDFISRVEIALAEIINASDNIGLILGAPIREKGLLYNSAILIENKKVLLIQHKSLLPNYDVFDESRYFTPATQRKAVMFKGKKLGITICEDIWNDKDFWNRKIYDIDPLEDLALQGVDYFINLSASPYHQGKPALRVDMLKSIAQKYQKAIIYVNQVGGNDDLVFDGCSLVIDANGRIVDSLPSFAEATTLVDLDLSPKEFTMPEEGIDWIYNALVLGIRDYMYKTGFKKAVIGLSGGIDSAVTAAMAVAALGRENVLGVSMPSHYSSEGSKDDARQLAQNLGIEYRVVPIESMFSAFTKELSPEGNFSGDLAEENIQARIRGNILMFISNREGYLTLTTGNKSEMAVGYCTLYGDMSGGLAVLADVPKIMVYDLARYINHDKEVIPNNTIVKPPSAELRPDQLDQDSLPPYEVLDSILRAYIEDNKSLDSIVKEGFDEALVKEIIGKVDINEYKRRQAAPGIRVTSKAFGIGRRLPIAQRFRLD